MRRNRLLLRSSLLAALIALSHLACSSGGGPNDRSDGGADADAGTTDAGPEPCGFDKGGFTNRGCDPGFVCNLRMDPPQCVAGKACTTTEDCRVCSDLQNPEDCGHGYPLTAWCDPSHDSVCVRSKSPCEPCETAADCGFTHPVQGSLQHDCVDYGNGQRFCGRPSSIGCPLGFTANTDGQCVRAGTEGCDAFPTVCPANTGQNPSCPVGVSDQICEGDRCSAGTGPRCGNNDVPGALGTCIDFCLSDSDCPSSAPVCNTRNGTCIEPCVPGFCAAGQVCHLDGLCAAACSNNGDCETDARYGPQSYCNTRSPAQLPPRYFKDYHDDNSCQRLGCERPVDCGGRGFVCDLGVAPPECVEGCLQDDDCPVGDVCKNAIAPAPGTSYSRQQCRDLPDVPNGNQTLIGTCCNPGCLDRNFDCGLNEWCCGEPGSPYEDESTCLTLTSLGSEQAEGGECFPMVSASSPAGNQQFCAACASPGSAAECSAPNRVLPGPDGVTTGWYPGFNEDPTVNDGEPFRELEFCTVVSMNQAVCSTTCNPTAPDDGCPGRQACSARFAPCCQDSDCGDLDCIGADCGADQPIAGRCRCGTDGVASFACPTTYGLIDRSVPFPRCVEATAGGDLFCVVAYNCVPPLVSQDPTSESGTNYPLACTPP